MKSEGHKNELVIPDVPIFHLNWDAGDMLMLALESCLKYLDQNVNSWWLAGISGDAFKFMYDKKDVREPMRDRVPIDTVSLACSSLGWEGKWYINETIDKVRNRIKHSLEQGYPVITSNLGTRWYHGANIITGINEDTNELFLQIGHEDISKSYNYKKIHIPEKWDGPVPGSIIWADNPIFILKNKTSQPEEEKIIVESIARVIDIYQGESLPYKDHVGAQKYSTPLLKGKTVNKGITAFNELKDEIKNSEITWPVIWSITTQCGQLLYDRSNASKFLKKAAEKYSQYFMLAKIADYYEEIINAANLLKQSYWDERLNKITKIEELVVKLKKGKSFVYNISNLKRDDINQLCRILPIMETLWGFTVILDNPRRRNYNLDLVDLIIDREKNCLNLFQRFLGKVKK
ncbi:MAG: hypothetical protein ACFFB0_13135 [Promethearchaeota archaeon]